MGLKDTFYNVKKSLVSWGADIRFYKGGIIIAGDSHYQIKGNDMRKVINTVIPGDIFLRKYDHYLGSVLIKGFWSHAAIYIGDDTVVHMMAPGIISEDILTFLRCDHIMILRVKDLNMASRICERAKMLASREIEYDYDFDSTDTRRLYCTEFVDVCADGIVSACVGKGKIILPDDFLKCSALEKIWTDVE
jgi:hypothetical protein